MDRVARKQDKEEVEHLDKLGQILEAMCLAAGIQPPNDISEEIPPDDLDQLLADLDKRMFGRHIDLEGTMQRLKQERLKRILGS